MDKDLNDIMLEFGHEVTTALNNLHVEPVGGHICAVMVVVAKDEDTEPVGCAINYNGERRIWSTLESVEVSRET